MGFIYDGPAVLGSRVWDSEIASTGEHLSFGVATPVHRPAGDLRLLVSRTAFAVCTPPLRPRARLARVSARRV
jgi:hypothetical protein